MGNDLGVSKNKVKDWKDRYDIPQDKVNMTLKAFRMQKGSNNAISKSKFIAVMAEHGVADEEFAGAIFDSFDNDGNGSIDIDEYMALMGVTFGGTVEDKLEASFNMFDKDGDGELDRDEIEQMVLMATRVVVRKQYNAGKARNKRATGSTEVDIPPELHAKIKEIINEIFDKVDKDGNGKLSREEFKQGFAEHNDICSFFKQF